jgi:transcriptional repressor NrdR
VQAFLEEIARLEHDLPELEKLQLSLLASERSEPRRSRKG